MIDDLLKIGDQVIITIPKENREWGYDPCHDGTVAEVIGFSEIAYGRTNNCGRVPGIYDNRCWVRLRLTDGKEHTESSMRLALVDQAEEARRLAQFRQLQQDHPDNWSDREPLRELPETPFWEGDIVHLKRLGYPYELRICGIEYLELCRHTLIGTPWPAYQVTDEQGGWHTCATPDQLDLLRRGNVWHYYHDEPLEFASLEAEASFYSSIGRTKEIRNPANGLYKWTKDEVLDAIRSGLAHGFTVSQGFFGSGPHNNAIRFLDEEVGQRVAAATLIGFAAA